MAGFESFCCLLVGFVCLFLSLSTPSPSFFGWFRGFPFRFQCADWDGLHFLYIGGLLPSGIPFMKNGSVVY